MCSWIHGERDPHRKKNSSALTQAKRFQCLAHSHKHLDELFCVASFHVTDARRVNSSHPPRIEGDPLRNNFQLPDEMFFFASFVSAGVERSHHDQFDCISGISERRCLKQKAFRYIQSAIAVSLLFLRSVWFCLLLLDSKPSRRQGVCSDSGVFCRLKIEKFF